MRVIVSDNNRRLIAKITLENMNKNILYLANIKATVSLIQCVRSTLFIFSKRASPNMSRCETEASYLNWCSASGSQGSLHVRAHYSHSHQKCQRVPVCTLPFVQLFSSTLFPDHLLYVKHCLCLAIGKILKEQLSQGIGNKSMISTWPRLTPFWNSMLPLRCVDAVFSTY